MGDRIAVVTGGNRGIGRAIATALAADGFAVAVTARDPATAAENRRSAEARPIKGRLSRSRSPPQPRTEIRLPSVSRLAAFSTFSTESGVCA